jgi:hypothetical protein
MLNFSCVSDNLCNYVLCLNCHEVINILKIPLHLFMILGACRPAISPLSLPARTKTASLTCRANATSRESLCFDFEGVTCGFNLYFRYGANGRFFYKKFASGKIKFDNSSFGGDPVPNVVKRGYYRRFTVGSVFPFDSHSLRCHSRRKKPPSFT